jgi:protein-tyrosine kinase
MGKIYQAMKQAQKDRNRLEAVAEAQESGSPSPSPETPPQPIFRPNSPEAQPRPRGLKGTKLNDEAEMNTLYQNIEARLSRERKKIIQFIGAQPGEGTTTVAWNFASFAASKLGKRVLLLEGDLTEVSGTFSGPYQGISLAETVQHGDEAKKAIGPFNNATVTTALVARDENLLLHFLQSEEQTAVWEDLKNLFDLVVINVPPLSVSTAGLAFCRHADGVVLILEAERTRGPVAERAKEQIEKNGGNILGVVFNKRRFYIPKSIYKRL